MIKLTQKSLINALTVVQNTIQKSGANEYLQAVSIKHCSEQLKFQTTDGDAYTEATIQDFQGSLDKSICLDFKKFFEVIKKYSPSDELTLAFSENADVLILSKGSRSCAEFPMQNPDNVPEFLDIQGTKENTIVFNKQDLQTSINVTHICIYPNEMRYHINGLHFNFQSENKKIDVVSTDGHRLAKFEIEDSSLEYTGKITIPRKIINAIRHGIENSTSEIKFIVDKTKLKIDFGSHILITKLIDSDFPDYNRVIPKDNTLIANFSTNSFTKSLERVSSIIANNIDPFVELLLQNNSITMKCSDSLVKTKEEIDCEFESGEFRLKANTIYLNECLKAITSKSFVFLMKDSNFPIRIEDAEDKRFLYIVMPAKL